MGPTRGRSRGNAHYIFPRHRSEIDRLDLQHYALHEALGGNYLAPIRAPQFVLDVGCGSGQWAYDLCTEYPDALVVGIDLVPSKPVQPPSKPVRLPNFRFVRSNVVEGLPFVPNRFDFVHQRLLVGGVPMNSWPSLVYDLARVTRPGGWIELVEVGFEVEPAGPATRRMVELMQRLGRSLGLDTTGIVLRSLSEYLRRTGDGHPTAECDPADRGMGGRIGSLLASDFRAAAMRACTVFQAKFGLSADECRDLLNAMPQEWEAHKTSSASPTRSVKRLHELVDRTNEPGRRRAVGTSAAPNPSVGQVPLTRRPRSTTTAVASIRTRRKVTAPDVLERRREALAKARAVRQAGRRGAGE